MKYFLSIIPCVLLLWSCPPSDPVSPAYQQIDVDLDVEILPKNFTVSIGDTVWIKTSINESIIQNAINGKTDIAKIAVVNFVFNLKNISQPNVLMQNNFFDFFINIGSFIQKKEKENEANFFLRMIKSEKKYELKVGFIMKKEGIFAFNFNTYSSTQVLNNYTDYFPSGGGVGFNKEGVFVRFVPKFTDKSINDKFFEQLQLNISNDKNSIYFKVQK